MWSLLTLSLAVAAPAGAAEPPGIVVFSAPVAPIVGAAFGPFSGGPPIVFVPIGLAFTASGVDWIADFAFVSRDPAPGLPGVVAQASALGSWLSFGPVVFSGQQRFNGFFVSPKLTLGLFRANDSVFGDVLVGVDTGYQATFGSLYLAFVFGASIGLGIDDDDEWAGPLVSFAALGRARGANLAFGINVQLLRVGWVF